MQAVGAPAYGEEALEFGREIQRNLGLEPMADPFIAERHAQLTPPRGERGQAARRRCRRGRSTSAPTTTSNTAGTRRRCACSPRRPRLRPPSPRLRLSRPGPTTPWAGVPAAVDPGHVRRRRRPWRCTAARPGDAAGRAGGARRPSSASAPAAASAATMGRRRCCRPTSTRRWTCAGRNTSRRARGEEWCFPTPNQGTGAGEAL